MRRRTISIDCCTARCRARKRDGERVSMMVWSGSPASSMSGLPVALSAVVRGRSASTPPGPARDRATGARPGFGPAELTMPLVEDAARPERLAHGIDRPLRRSPDDRLHVHFEPNSCRRADRGRDAASPRMQGAGLGSRSGDRTRTEHADGQDERGLEAAEIRHNRLDICSRRARRMTIRPRLCNPVRPGPTSPPLQ